MARHETLQQAVARMRREGWSEKQIQGQVRRWHPEMGSTKRTKDTHHQSLLDASRQAFDDPIAKLKVKAPVPLEQEQRGSTNPFLHEGRLTAPPIHGTPSRNVWEADVPVKKGLDILSGRRTLTGKRVDPNSVVLRRDPRVKGSRDYTAGDAIAMGMADAPLAVTGLVRQLGVQAGQRAVDNPAGVAAAIGHPLRTGRQVALNTAETARHPLRHPFDTALLAWALASGGASLAERAAMAGRGKGFVRAPLETAKLRSKGGIEVEYPLSRNPIAKSVQRGRAKRLQARLDRGSRERIPRSKLGKTFVAGLDLFGPEAKIRRELNAERVTEEAILQGPLSEMHDAARHLDREEHVALRLAAIEGDSAFVGGDNLIQRHMEKAQHDHATGALSDDDYLAEMADLKMAAPVLANPSDRFLKALEKTRSLSQKTEDALTERGILDRDTATGRRGKIADLYQPGGLDRAAERRALRDRLEGTRPPKKGEEADLRERLAENESMQGQPYTKTHLRYLRREQSALHDRLEEIETHKQLAAHDSLVPPDGSFYFPLSQRYTHSLLHSADNVRFGGPQPSALGSPRAAPSAQIGSLKKEFTGKSTAQHLPADIVARGLSQRYARTVRLTSAHDIFDRLYHTGSPVRQSEYDVPLRLTPKARDEIKQLLAKASDKLEANPDATELLTANELEALSKSITVDDPGVAGAPVGGPEIKDVRWVDRRLMPDLDIASREGFQRAFDTINNPIRFADLYIRPAYALNALGNAGMAMITQGHLAPANIRNALRVVSQLGEENAAQIRAGMGESRTQSYLPGGGRQARALGPRRESRTGRFVRKVSNQSLAQMWNRITDVWFRDSAFINAAHKAGYDTPEKLDELLNDKTLQGARRQVFRRARKDSVDFQSMTPVEKNYIRRVVYFYPWMSRASIWAMRALIEHPGKAYTLAALARIGGERSDEETGPQPEWLDKIGPIALGADKDRVKLLNPTSINTFSTAEQAGRAGLQTVGNLLGLRKGGGLADIATPGAALFAQQAGGGGDTAQGTGLPGVLEGTPQYQALRRLGIVGSPPKTYPDTGWGPALGPFTGGGLYPRSADKAVIADQYAKQASKSARSKKARADTERIIDQAQQRGEISPQEARQAKLGLSDDPEDRRTLVIETMREDGSSDAEINATLHQLGYEPIGG